VDARKHTFHEREALALLEDVDEIYASKGKKISHVNLKGERPDRETLLGLLLGPTGNLRAPTVRIGRTLMVGFDEASYRKLLK